MFQNVVRLLVICAIVFVRYSFAFDEIANNKPAFLSSLYSGSYPPENINDGNLNTFSHTNGEMIPYVYIDLMDTYSVQRVEIYNRADCCSDRLVGGVVRIGVSADDVRLNTQCGEPVTSDEIATGTVIVRECDRSVFARFVSVTIENGISVILNLGEIKVFGELSILYNNHCYTFFTTATTWSGAKSACESSSSTLLTINTEEERTHLTDMMSSFDSLSYMWTGLNDIAVEGNPVWLTHDHPIYTDYDQGSEEDDSEGMDCFRLAAGDSSLRHTDCNLELGYVCEARSIIYEKYAIAANNKSPNAAYVVRSVLAVSPGACSLECGRLNGCSSFSFNRMSRECQLSTSTGQSEQLVDAQTVDFYVGLSSEVTCG